MNKPSRATRLPAGATPAAGHPVMKTDNKNHSRPAPKHRMTGQAITAKSTEDKSISIAEPLRFHRARYEQLTQSLQGRCHLAAVALSCLILLMLTQKAANGEHISPERWLCGGLSGWFIVSMTRLALFTCLAAPRYICHKKGKLRISGLGILRPEQILYWSIERKVMIHPHEKTGSRVHICYRRLGWDWHWAMLMEEGPETERLIRLLEAAAPRTADLAVRHMRRAIPIEAGILSQ